jgi:hypothetical protein
MQLNGETFLIIFVALTGVAVLMQAFVLIGILMALRKASEQAVDLVEDLRTNVLPTMQSAGELLVKIGPVVEQLTPQVIAVTSSLVSIANDLRDESANLRRATADIGARLQRQTARVDLMLTNSLDKVEVLSGLVESVVTIPARQANGVVMAFKAALDTYIGVRNRRTITRTTIDRDGFV